MAKPRRPKTTRREDIEGGNKPAAPQAAENVNESPPPKPRRRRKKPAAPPQTPYEPPHPPQQQQPPEGAVERTLALAPEEILADEGGPKSEKDILNNLFGQAFTRYTKRSVANKGVETIAEVVSRIQEGQSLQEMQASLSKILGEQQAKTMLLQATMFNHQMERVALHWDMRWLLERELWQDLREKKLSTAEKLALLKLSCGEADKAADYINDNSQQYTPPAEIEPIVERASKPATDQERTQLREEFKGTTPQGREIIRRMTAKAKAVSAKIVKEHTHKPDGTDTDRK